MDGIIEADGSSFSGTGKMRGKDNTGKRAGSRQNGGSASNQNTILLTILSQTFQKNLEDESEGA